MSSLESLTAEQRAFLAAGELLLKNPEVALEAKKLIRKVKPEVRFAELETHDQVEAATKKLREEQEKLSEQLNKDRLERALAEQRASLRAEGINVEQLEAFMKENELYSYEKAKKIFALVNKPAAPTPPKSVVETMQETDMKAFWSDPVKAARQEAEKFFKERAAAGGI